MVSAALLMHCIYIWSTRTLMMMMMLLMVVVVVVVFVDVLSSPVNVELRRLSSTVLQVSWDPPPRQYHDLITGYHVYYHISSSHMAPPRGHDLTHTRWEVKDVGGPLRVTELAGLKPRTQYVVRVRARGVDGRLGNISEAVMIEDDDSVTAGSLSCVLFISTTSWRFAHRSPVYHTERPLCSQHYGR